MPAVEFGKTGMGRDILEEIFSAHIYPKQQISSPSNLSLEQYRWMLVDDHVSNFNKKNVCNYHPSYSRFVDESMSRWCGIVGHWINASLPQYISIYRKPENGCEI